MATCDEAVIYTDGACSGNPGPAGAGYVIAAPDGEILAEDAVAVGHGTNNIAEYSGAIAALERARELGLRNVTVRSDSELMCKQVWGQYRIKNPGIAKLHVQLRRAMEGFDSVKFEHVAREKNERADALARQGVEKSRKKAAGG
ncbi:MAG: ribonuclease HI family protein [Armatimonadetes bacterium]|nr:ribonuclease HI family protein [Armatimonadota bacterium]